MLLNNSICDSVTVRQDSPCFNQSYQLSEQSCHTHLITFCISLTAVEMCRAGQASCSARRKRGDPQGQGCLTQAPLNLWNARPRSAMQPSLLAAADLLSFSVHMAWPAQWVLGHKQTSKSSQLCPRKKGGRGGRQDKETGMTSQPPDWQESVQRWTGSGCWDSGGKAAMTEGATRAARWGRTKVLGQIRAVLCSPGKRKQTRTGLGAGNINRHQAGP